MVPGRPHGGDMTHHPESFVWGVATSAYQIEGAVAEDGRGPSIWDTFSHVPGKTAGGETGDIACDHYHRLDEDLDALADLGVDAYRFSVAWPRVQPTGSGPVNRKGLDFYRRIGDGLRERGIAPFVTLYHWDLPQALEDLGGWRSRDTAARFAEYAAIVADAIGDTTHSWITLNEPYCSAITSYAEGRHAPGAQEGHGALAAAHHLLLGHGWATAALRQAGPAPVGITLNMSPAVPVSPDPSDLAAAARQDLLVNKLFTDPVLGGVYPALAREVFGDITDFSFLRDGDLDVISAPLDFLGVNYYYRIHVRDVRVEEPAAQRSAYRIGVASSTPEHLPKSMLGWPIEPVGLYDTLAGLRERHPELPPVYITENGIADDGRLDDTERIDFIGSHLAAVDRAMADGVDVRGYFYWSMWDNFEWARGYAPRFGLVHVDYATGRRTPKSSYHWLRERLAAR
jgi:beta-glucosidase